jgi:hypothetical protein
MQLSAALKRVGGEIRKESITEKQATLYLRIDPEQGEKWVEAITSFLLQSESKPFTSDVSKYFFVSQGEIRYLWRVFVEGDVTMALQLFGSCVFEAAQRLVPQYDSFPLIGRTHYEFNPAKGKLKGAHDIEASSAIVSQAIAGGAPSVSS